MDEAIRRIINIQNVKVDGEIMLITASIGLFFNIINMLVLEYAFNPPAPEAEIKVDGETDAKTGPQNLKSLQHLTGESTQVESGPASPENEEKAKVNFNVKAAQIHMIGDCIQAVGVLIAAILIYINPDWKIADPITTLVFVVLVLCVTIPVAVECFKILMEHVPSDLDTKELYKKILSVSHIHA